MSSVGLRGVVTGSFLLSLGAAAPSARASSPLSSSSTTSLSQSLRIGAQTYTAALEGLNSSIAYLNLSQAKLEQLHELTGKMVSLAEEASRASTGMQRRRSLDLEFQRLGTQFRKVLEESVLKDDEYLTVEGLSEVFQRFGLDREQSNSIAKVFARFITVPGDEKGALASEEIKAKPSQRSVPISAYTLPASSDPYTVTKVTGEEVVVGMISAVNSTFSSHADVLYSSKDTLQPYMQSLVGGLSGVGANVAASAPIALLSTNAESGYSVVESRGDFLGYNATHASQLFLLDERGAFVAQLTNNTAETLTYTGADISADGRTVAYGTLDITTGDVEVVIATRGSIDEDPALSTRVVAYSAIGGGETLAARSVQLTNDGQTFGFYQTANALWIGNSETLDYKYSDNNESDLEGFSLINGSTVAVVSKSENGARVEAFDIAARTVLYDSGLLTGEMSPAYVGIASTESGMLAYFTSEADSLRLVKLSGDTAAPELPTVPTGTVFQSVSLAERDGKLDIGVVGKLGGTEHGFWRYSANALHGTTRRIGQTQGDYHKLFDAQASIERRPDAHRVLADLKELHQQLKSNIKTMDELRQVLADNVNVVRATALALLEMEGQVGSNDDAEQVAARVRDLIRQNARGSLGQIENLERLRDAAVKLLSQSAK